MIIFCAFAFGSSAAHASFFCDLNLNMAKVEASASQFVEKIKGIEPKFSNIKWKKDQKSRSQCLASTFATDGRGGCSYFCNAQEGNHGLKMHISQNGELLGFTSF